MQQSPFPPILYVFPFTCPCGMPMLLLPFYAPPYAVLLHTFSYWYLSMVCIVLYCEMVLPLPFVPGGK